MKNKIQTHYGSDDLLEKIKNALEKAGKNPDKLALKDLSVIDQLHTGGHLASMELAEKARIKQNMKILDAGCGIGGTSRLLAKKFNSNLIGIDLVEKFIDAAEFLTKSTGLGHRVKFLQMSIPETSFEDDSFDCIWCQHTLMNIDDKHAAFTEFSRILKPGGILVLHEIIRGNNTDAEIYFPVPWADRPYLSFLISMEKTVSMLEDSGFELNFYEDQTKQAKQWWNKVKAAAKKNVDNPRPLGPHIIFGENGKLFGKTMSSNLDENLIKVVAAVYFNKKSVK